MDSLGRVILANINYIEKRPSKEINEYVSQRKKYV